MRPSCHVRVRDAARVAAEPGATVLAEGMRDLDGVPVARVALSRPADVPALRDRLAAAGIPTYEADIRHPYRFLVEHGLRCGLAIEGGDTPAGPGAAPGLRLFRNPRLYAADVRPQPRVLSLDIETTASADEIFAIALVAEDVDEVHLVGDTDVTGAIVHPAERALLAAVLARIRALDPDVLTGWNVVDFDLRAIARRCAALRLACEPGRVAGAMRFEQDASYARSARAVVAGRMVLDGLSLVHGVLRLEDHRLETVARAVLGRGKAMRPGVADPVREIERMRREDPVALVAYNREDARLVLDILRREGLVELAVERARLTGMQLDRVGASIASFDLLYLPELHRRGVVAPNVRADREAVAVAGGAVLEPRPGLHRDVAVLDFRSLYPSLIRTFGLDPLAHARARPGEPAVEAPNGARFARDVAILPAILERLAASRDAARMRGDRHADRAIKILMNSLFGVLGTPACRFFDAAVANAITAFGQEVLRWSREAIEAAGFEVLYGDTDSLFVLLGDGDGTPAAQRAEAVRGRVEVAVGERVRAAHGVEPRLVLELEMVLDRLLLPRVRGGRGGSRKRYAGWVDGRLHLVGLEAVRRDSPAIARRLQEGMLERLFTDRPIEPFVAEVVRRLRAGELDGELVVARRIRKGSPDRYDGRAPHVEAARRAGPSAGPVIRYVVTRGGPEPVLPGRPFPPGIDREHYVRRVLEPIADAILCEVGGSFGDAIGRPRQLELL